MRPGAYPRVEHLKGALLGLAPALQVNIRLGWKGLPGTNALAYMKAIRYSRKMFYRDWPLESSIMLLENIYSTGIPHDDRNLRS